MKIFIKEHVKNLVAKKGYSITDLSIEIGISKQGLYQCLNRKVGIMPKNATKLSALIGQSFDELFEFVERKPNEKQK